MEESRSRVPRKLWEHPDPEATLMWKFMQEVNEKSNRSLKVKTHSLACMVRLLSGNG